MSDKAFKIIVLLILLVSIFLRFYNYGNRWGLGIDQAHDALVARYALETHKIPLLGPFSSAGPFQTGGEWYWLIMLGTMIYPFSVMTPWIFMTSLYILFVFLMIRLGEELIDRKFGILLGILSAVSTAQVSQSTNLTNQSPLALFSLLAIWSCFRFTRTKNALYLFLLGFFVSFGATIHLQGVALVFLIIATLIFTKYKNLKGYLYLLIGLFLPLTPIFISDLSHNFFNFRNMLYYYLYDQYKIPLDLLGRRWTTYAGVFWPKAWSFIMGGNILLGAFFLLGFLSLILEILIKRKSAVIWNIFFATLLGVFVILRYTHTPLYDSYLVFLHPLVLLISGFIIYRLFKIKALAGILILIIIVIFSLQKDFAEINYSKLNQTEAQTLELKKILTSSFPKEKFAIYDYKLKNPLTTFSLSLFLDSEGRINDTGRRIGIATAGANFNEKSIFQKSGGYVFLDLSNIPIDKLAKEEWSLVNPSQIYFETEEWNNK